MTTLSSSVTTLLVHRDVRCGGPPLGLRALNHHPARASRDALGFLGASSRHHDPLSGTIEVQRVYRESTGHHSRRKSSQKKSWQCFAELQKSESEATDTATEIANISSSSGSPPNCCTDAAEERVSTSAGDAKEEAVRGDSGPVFETYGPGKRGNQLVALASVTVAVGLFLSGRLASAGPGLPQLAADSISYEEALSNGRPTVLEFYADWCEVCKETARDVYQVEQEFKDRINFVMLNVDNSKWDEELDEFGVEGIPHFSFLDKQGNEEGNIVGRLPRKILKENLAALVRGDATVPHSRVVGQFSSADSKQAPSVVGPRSHSQMS